MPVVNCAGKPPACRTSAALNSQRPSGRTTGVRIRPVMRDDRWRSWSSCPGFPSPFGRRHSLHGHPVPPGSSAPLAVGLPRRHPRRWRGPERGFHVPHARDPAGLGVLCTPGATVSTRPRMVPDRRCRFTTARPCHPATARRPGVCLSRGINKDSLDSPVQPSSRLWPPRRSGRPLGFPLSFIPPRHQMPRRMSGRGQVFDTDPGYVSGISQPPPRSHSQRATSCRNHR